MAAVIETVLKKEFSTLDVPRHVRVHAVTVFTRQLQLHRLSDSFNMFLLKDKLQSSLALLLPEL